MSPKLGQMLPLMKEAPTPIFNRSDHPLGPQSPFHAKKTKRYSAKENGPKTCFWWMKGISSRCIYGVSLVKTDSFFGPQMGGQNL